MTHIFQPADQYIISNIRQQTRKGLGAALEDRLDKAGDFTELDQSELFGDGADARRRKAALTADAFRSVSGKVVLRSWHITAIPKYLLKDQTDVFNGYDEAVSLVAKDRGGEVPVSKINVVDSDVEIDVDAEEEDVVQQNGSPVSKKLRFEEQMAHATGETKEKKERAPLPAAKRQQRRNLLRANGFPTKEGKAREIEIQNESTAFSALEAMFLKATAEIKLKEEKLERWRRTFGMGKR